MSGAHAVVQRLFSHPSDTAFGIGVLLQELLNLVKPCGNSPIIVEYMNTDGTIREMMFGRQSLSSRNYSSALDVLKQDFGLVQAGQYNEVNIMVTGGLFYNADGTVQTMPMSMSQTTWSDLVPHVHKIFIRHGTVSS